MASGRLAKTWNTRDMSSPSPVCQKDSCAGQLCGMATEAERGTGAGAGLVLMAVAPAGAARSVVAGAAVPGRFFLRAMRVTQGCSGGEPVLVIVTAIPGAVKCGPGWGRRGGQE